MGIERGNEDLGQTLGYWGIGAGPYVVIPFLGPSSARDLVGRYGDGKIDPVALVSSVPVRNSLMGARVVDTRVSLFPAEALMNQAAGSLHVHALGLPATASKPWCSMAKRPKEE